MSDANKKQAPTQDEIAVRAYEIYLERGSVPGEDVSHWLEAEAELAKDAEMQADDSQSLRLEPRIVDSPISAPSVTSVRSRATVA
jgi:hypothetical protein